VRRVRASGSALQVAAAGPEDLNGPVHILRKNRTISDVASFDKSFELMDRFATGAMEGNVGEFSVFLFAIGVQLKVVGHCLEWELELWFIIRRWARMHKKMVDKVIVNQSGSLDSGFGIMRGR